MNSVRIVENNGAYEIISPYNAGFIAEIKAKIPASKRKYSADRNYSWLIDPEYGDLIVRLVAQYYGQTVQLPMLFTIKEPITGILDILYLGACKERADGSSTASGWMEGEWKVVFPESVLRKWFDDGREKPKGNYYSVLGIKTGATEDEIKTAYRRMAMQWHPDKCHEPCAEQAFRKIQIAYDALKDPKKRARYEAGLIFEASLKQNEISKSNINFEVMFEAYRAPLRCGKLMCSYTEQFGKLFVMRILLWSDIYNDVGKTLVSSWIMGENAPRIEWV